MYPVKTMRLDPACRTRQRVIYLTSVRPFNPFRCVKDTVRTLLLVTAFTINLASAEIQSCNQRLSETANKVQIQVQNQLITMHMGDLTLVVDASLGGRITEFSLAGNNALSSEGELIGSTFWTSPQSDWGWPPPTAIDSDAYDIQQQGSRFKLIGRTESNLGVRVEKTFSPSVRGNGIDITYTLRNMSDHMVKYAPWEVTRVPGGYTFYPSTGQRIRDDLKTTEIDRIIWYFYQADELSIGVNQKVLDNGREGWIANANPDSGLLFIKTYPDINLIQFATGEAEIELYASPLQNYIEIEQQGAYMSIPPMSSVDWTVTWYLQNIGKKSIVGIGDQELVRRVRATVQ